MRKNGIKIGLESFPNSEIEYKIAQNFFTEYKPLVGRVIKFKTKIYPDGSHKRIIPESKSDRNCYIIKAKLIIIQPGVSIISEKRKTVIMQKPVTKFYGTFIQEGSSFYTRAKCCCNPADNRRIPWNY